MDTFPKSEKINFSRKPDPAPRVIQPRSPRYNVEVGRSLKKMENALKDGHSRMWGGPTVMKGYNANATAMEMRKMWDQFNRPVAISIDAVRFDQHVSADALEYEHSVYLDCVPQRDRATLARLLRWQIQNRGFYRGADGTIKYEVLGRRMSGDMNTGMGNCLLMCTLFWTYLKQHGIRGRLANNGDDCVLIVESHNLRRINDTLSQFFLEAGFVLTVEKPVYVFEEIDFCQCHPVQVPGGWRMVRDPRTAVDKDLTTQLNISDDKGFAAWRSAMGQCELALGSGIPVWQCFAEMLLRDTSGPAPTIELIHSSGMSFLCGNMTAKHAPIAVETRVSFWRAFGITPDMQQTMETTFLTTQLNNRVNDLRISPLLGFNHLWQ
jgi:hypothetical protein